jgi:Cdc6-related protein, AAA superfamily ATPase
VSSVFPSVALELLAGKVASTCGDIRRALDIGRRVIELSEAQKFNQVMPLKPTVDHGMYELSIDEILSNWNSVF